MNDNCRPVPEPDIDAAWLDHQTDERLRLFIAQAAGLLAYREGGYGFATAAMLRNVADKLVRS